MPSVTIKPLPSHYRPGGFAAFFLKHWGPSLALWGVGAGVYVTYFLSVTPLVKREFLTKIPVLGYYYVDKTPIEDKPF